MKKKINIRWQLVLYDIFILLAVDILLLTFSVTYARHGNRN